jgi:hypothetical protein
LNEETLQQGFLKIWLLNLLLPGLGTVCCTGLKSVNRGMLVWCAFVLMFPFPGFVKWMLLYISLSFFGHVVYYNEHRSTQAQRELPPLREPEPISRLATHPEDSASENFRRKMRKIDAQLQQRYKDADSDNASSDGYLQLGKAERASRLAFERALHAGDVDPSELSNNKVDAKPINAHSAPQTHAPADPGAQTHTPTDPQVIAHAPEMPSVTAIDSTVSMIPDPVAMAYSFSQPVPDPAAMASSLVSSQPVIDPAAMASSLVSSQPVIDPAAMASSLVSSQPVIDPSAMASSLVTSSTIPDPSAMATVPSGSLGDYTFFSGQPSDLLTTPPVQSPDASAGSPVQSVNIANPSGLAGTSDPNAGSSAPVKCPNCGAACDHGFSFCPSCATMLV